MTRLSVNLNAVAQLRNRRDLPWPSVTGIAKLVIEAGAAGITVHPRPDERHIRRTDVFDLSALLAADHPGIEFNIEGYPTDQFLELVETVRPHQATLVPDDPSQSTSDHGWDFAAHSDFLSAVTARLKGAGARVSLFCDPDAGVEGIARAQKTGADRIELYTGPYGACYADSAGAAHQLALMAETADAARAAGLGINAGHDLTVSNLPAFIARVAGVDEVSIGHGITADALLMGFPEAVRRYNAALGS
ncbi:pyridoxine 5'-phosphate synthase [Pelagibacterium montanilacus]|uniref:pyridoxine 5'-phosphate synthase n=1 Tax=Pelagibacterium montanilacus TaxID=2185280 RepID=UPI000F8E5AB0|nr:pyridoxine 5'-phosphate synthase [Pelagibacterium montanilacus]